MAIVEGILLRGPRRWAAATRLPDGRIAVRSGEVPTWSTRWAERPFVRGIAALADALALGVRAVLWSGDLHAPEGKGRGGDVSRGRVVAAVVPGLAITIGLVFVVPAVAAGILGGGAFVEAAARVVVLCAYLAGVGQLPLVRRVFGYHGAEHKVVALHESGAPRTVEEARRRSLRHGRCGTTFLAVVVVVTSVLHVATAPFHDGALPTLLLVRLALVPVIAAVAYELLTAANRRPASLLARVVLRPGMALQALTVAEPDDDQLEVALVALREALADQPMPAGELVAA